MTIADRDLLSLDAIRAGLDKGYTLPTPWYVDPAHYRLEQEKIFRRTWQYVGLQQDVPNHGDFFRCNAGELPLVITRDEEGQLHALVNVCRHRGAEVVTEPCGTKKALQCMYHAWTYGLDGALKAAPGMRQEENFDRADFAMATVQVDTWGPFIFVNPDPNAAPLSSVLGELPGLVDATGLRLNEVKRRFKHHYDIDANWKIVVDNYLECYHCPVAHPGFTALIDTDNYTVTEYEWYSTQGGGKRETPDGQPGLYNTDGVVKDGFYAMLFPNWTINIYPGPGILSINLFLPMGHNKTRAIFEYCFVDEIPEDDEKDFIKFIDQVQVEDIELCNMVHRGLATGYLERGKLMLKQEQALRHFQGLVHRCMAE